MYKCKNHPLPLTAEESLEIQIILSLFASLFILIPLCYIPASFVVFVVRERVSKSKHLQLVSSVSPYLYWVSTFLWDMGLYLVLTAGIMIAFYSYGEESSRIFIDNGEATLAVFLLLLLYGASAIPLGYIYSFAFDNHSTAQITIMTINFFTGFVAVMAYFIMISVPATEEVGEQLVHVFRIFPPYNIGEGLINISTAYFENNLLDGDVSYLAWKVTGRNIIFMMLESVGYFGIILISESPSLRAIRYYCDRCSCCCRHDSAVLGLNAGCLLVLGFFRLSQIRRKFATLSGPVPPPTREADKDVDEERRDMALADAASYTLLLRDIVKTYPSPLACGKAKHAVRGLSLGCAAGERFGLLGINGAGARK